MPRKHQRPWSNDSCQIKTKSPARARKAAALLETVAAAVAAVVAGAALPWHVRGTQNQRSVAGFHLGHT